MFGLDPDVVRDAQMHGAGVGKGLDLNGAECGLAGVLEQQQCVDESHIPPRNL